MRERESLDGRWTYQIDPRNVGERLGWADPDADRSAWPPIAVPVCAFDVDAPDNPLKGYEGSVWFSRTVVVPEAWRERSIHLRFEGSNYGTAVWWNGQRLADHDGAFVGFSVPIPAAAITYGEKNVIVVRTNNDPLPSRVPGPIYGWWNHGGLYREVALESRPHLALDDVTVKTEVSNTGDVQLTVDVDVANQCREDAACEIAWEMNAPGGRSVASGRLPAGPLPKGGIRRFTLQDKMARPRLWSPEDPYLYTLSVKLLQGDAVQDGLDLPVGMRQIRVQDAKIFLNNREILIKGVNRHEDYASAGRAHAPDWLLHDLRLLKEMGVNLIRTSHYPNHPDFYRLTDQLGFLVMDEIPFYWWGVEWVPSYRSEAAVTAAELQLEEMVRRDKRHPSVVFWSVSNETKGGDPAVDGANRRLMMRAREIDPTRLAVYVSARWHDQGSFGVDGALGDADVVCINEYFGLFGGETADTIDEIQEVAPQLKQAMEDLRDSFPQKPIVVTEFGCPGLFGFTGGHFGTEDYQAEFVRFHAETLIKMPNVRGLVYWAYGDYPGHRARTVDAFPTGYYGLVTRGRQQKPVLSLLGSIYAGWETASADRRRSKP